MSKIIPAAPGFYFLQATEDGGELYFDEVPVIAWNITLDEKGNVDDKEPITTVAGYYLTYDDATLAQAVLAPNGRVYDWIDPGEHTDRADWEAHMTKRCAARLALNNKKAAA